MGLQDDKNMWLPRSQLEAMGFAKMVQEIDSKEAAKQGLYSRPLTQASPWPCTHAHSGSQARMCRQRRRLPRRAVRVCAQAMISKFLEDFGLESEFSTHSLMRGLSGGQKVKVVLAAAMWLNPHMLILVRTRARPLVVVVRCLRASLPVNRILPCAMPIRTSPPTTWTATRSARSRARSASTEGACS